MSQFPVLANDHGIRPAGKPDTCFYCGSKVGEMHQPDCVTIQKRVKVRYTFELEIEAPHAFTAEQIESMRNDGSWCADNALGELDAHAKWLGSIGQCLCGAFHCEVLDASGEPYVETRDRGE